MLELRAVTSADVVTLAGWFPDEDAILGVPLVTAALGEARRLGLTIVDLLDFAGNASARRTYAAAGFRDLGGLPEYPSVLRMVREL